MLMRCVEKLNDEEIKILKRIINCSNNYRVRNRAHAIILSYEKYNIDLISDIFKVHRATVNNWIKAWEEYGLQGLYDSPRPGRPRLVKIYLQQQYAG